MKLIEVVASRPITYVRKYMDLGDHMMLFDEIAPKVTVISTDVQSIGFVNEMEHLVRSGSNCKVSPESIKWSGLLRCAFTVETANSMYYELYEETGPVAAGYPAVYIHPLARGKLATATPSTIEIRAMARRSVIHRTALS